MSPDRTWLRDNGLLDRLKVQEIDDLLLIEPLFLSDPPLKVVKVFTCPTYSFKSAIERMRHA